MIDLQRFGRVDHGSLKAFVAAAKALNFTAAAREAAMTQSGVSQHVARLERQLDAQLFARANRRVRLTRAGEILLRFAERSLEDAARLIDEIHGETGLLRGAVRYGMPHSCLFTPHFPLLLEKRAAFPAVDLQVRLIPNGAIFDALSAGEIDFGFVTQVRRDPAIRYRLFAREEYVLVGRDRPKARSWTKDELLARPFVGYPGMDALFELWARRHFGARAPSHASLQIAGFIDSLQGAVTMLRHGVGLTVIPKHCVEPELKAKALFEHGRLKRPLLNDIFVVSLAGVSQPRRVQTVMDAFWEMKAAS